MRVEKEKPWPAATGSRLHKNNLHTQLIPLGPGCQARNAILEPAKQYLPLSNSVRPTNFDEPKENQYKRFVGIPAKKKHRAQRCPKVMALRIVKKVVVQGFSRGLLRQRLVNWFFRWFDLEAL